MSWIVTVTVEACCASAQVWDLTEQLRHEQEAHKHTTCAANRANAQLQDLGEEYRQQVQAQAEAREEAQMEFEDNLVHWQGLTSDMARLQCQVDSLHDKCRQQKQQLRDHAEDRRRSANSLASIVDELHQVRGQTSELSTKLSFAQEQLAARDEYHRQKSDAFERHVAALTGDIHKLQHEILVLEEELQDKQELQQQSEELSRTQAGLQLRLVESDLQLAELRQASDDDQCRLQNEVLRLDDRLQLAEQAKLRLQQQSHLSSSAQAHLELKLCELQRSEAQADLRSTQAYLGKLHALAVSDRITPEALFRMFGDPVATAVVSDVLGEDSGAATNSISEATAGSPSATTTATAADDTLKTPASTPMATPDKLDASPAATAGDEIATTRGPVATGSHNRAAASDTSPAATSDASSAVPKVLLMEPPNSCSSSVVDSGVHPGNCCPYPDTAVTATADPNKIQGKFAAYAICAYTDCLHEVMLHLHRCVVHQPLSAVVIFMDGTIILVCAMTAVDPLAASLHEPSARSNICLMVWQDSACRFDC